MDSLGYITIAAGGTPQRVTTKEIIVKSVTITPAPANAGLGYAGSAAFNTTTGAGVWRIIPKPASATAGPFDGTTITTYDVPGGINLNMLYLDGTTNDKFLVSYVRG